MNTNNDTGIKILESQNHPFDVFLYKIIRHITPTFKKLNFTPNFITLLSLVFSVIGIYLFYKQTLLPLAAFLLLVGYLCDCWDGYFARKYNMVSRFGDYFDHGSDIIKYILYIVVLFKLKRNNNHFIKYMIAIGVLSFLLLIQLGCEEKIYNKSNESETLKLTKLLCPDKKMIRLTKYFGAATLMITMAVIMLIYR